VKLTSKGSLRVAFCFFVITQVSDFASSQRAPRMIDIAGINSFRGASALRAAWVFRETAASLGKRALIAPALRNRSE
jgi:hypothetical protein